MLLCVTDQQTATRLFAEMVYNTGIPLQFVEHASVQTFLNFIRPSFKIPSRYQLSTPLLFMVFTALQAQVHHHLSKLPFVTLGWDGWSRKMGEKKIVNFHVNSFGSSIFLDSHCAGGASITSKYTVDRVKEVVSRHDLEGKLAALVTDSPSVNVLARSMLQEEYPALVVTGCMAHALSLVLKDIMEIPAVSSVVEKCRGLVKLFRRSSTITELLEVASMGFNVNRKLQLDVATRWGSTVKMLSCALLNR